MAAAKLTPLGIAVLELLHEKPMHPYEMATLMRERYVDTRVNVKAGSLYHTVERLHRNGFIVFRGGSTDSHSRRRQILPDMIRHMKEVPGVAYGITCDGSNKRHALLPRYRTQMCARFTK